MKTAALLLLLPLLATVNAEYIMCTYTCDPKGIDSVANIYQGVDVNDCPDNPYPSCYTAFVANAEATQCISPIPTVDGVAECNTYVSSVNTDTGSSYNATQYNRFKLSANVANTFIQWGVDAAVSKICSKIPSPIKPAPPLDAIASPDVTVTWDQVANFIVNHAADCLQTWGVNVLCAYIAPEAIPFCTTAVDVILKLPVIRDIVSFGKKVVTSVASAAVTIAKKFFRIFTEEEFMALIESGAYVNQTMPTEEEFMRLLDSRRRF